MGVGDSPVVALAKRTGDDGYPQRANTNTIALAKGVGNSPAITLAKRTGDNGYPQGADAPTVALAGHVSNFPAVILAARVSNAPTITLAKRGSDMPTVELAMRCAGDLPVARLPFSLPHVTINSMATGPPLPSQCTLSPPLLPSTIPIVNGNGIVVQFSW